METRTFCTAEEDPCRLDFVYYLNQNVSQTLCIRITESEAARGGKPIWFPHCSRCLGTLRKLTGTIYVFTPTRWKAVWTNCACHPKVNVGMFQNALWLPGPWRVTGWLWSVHHQVRWGTSTAASLTHTFLCPYGSHHHDWLQGLRWGSVEVKVCLSPAWACLQGWRL